jgi:L-threonylcarbamoyladenylate synthase
LNPLAPSVETAVCLLLNGKVVAFPTETVYGLGADATNAKAVAKIFALKGRPSDHPLIVHIADPDNLEKWAYDIPPAATKLANHFWPGPLTLILKTAPRMPSLVTGGDETVGLRCPSHPIAQELLREFAAVGSGAIAAPSANKFGRVSPTTAQHVRDEFGPELYLLDGGDCEVGLESTIVDFSRGTPVLLRPGAVTRQGIEDLIHDHVRDRDADAPRASGTLEAHYAPRTALQLVEGAKFDARVRDESDVAVLALRGAPKDARVRKWIHAPAGATGYGHDLYANLRRLDAAGAGTILVEAPPASFEWEAVNDRLGRAAAGSGSLADGP